MRRTVTLRPGATLAGLVLALAGSLVAGVLVAAPGSAAVSAPGPAAPAAGDRAAAATTPGTSPTTAAPTTPRSPSGTPSTVICPTYTSPPPWPNGVGPAWTFEDGTARSWYALPGSGVTLRVTNEAAASGTGSLRLDGVTATAAARVTPSALPSVTWFKVTARVRAVAGSSPAYVTLSATPTSADDRRPMVRRVTSGGWTTLTTYFRPDQRYPSGTCAGLGWVPASTDVTITAATPCPDAPTGPVSLYVDDVAVTLAAAEGAPVPPPTSTDQLPTCGTPPPSTPPTTSAMQCTASYQVVSQWQGGHQANLTVRNLTAMTLHPWTLQITFPDTGPVYSFWGAGTWTQSGATLVANEPSWGQPLPPGGSVTVGLVRAGAARPPTAVALNGMPCVLAVA